MASVHRRPRSPYWHAAFRGPEGRLILRSTKQQNRGKAEAVAKEFERATQLAKAGLLVEDQARKVVGAIMERAGGGDTLRSPIAAVFLREWMAGKELNKRARTADRYRPIIEGFIESLGIRSQRPLLAVTAEDVQRYINGRIEEGCAPGTVQVDGKILRTAFNRARRMGLISTNPAEAVELPDRACIERGTFTAPEVRMLVEAAEDEWKTLILLAYYTGQRLMDCAHLKWSSVNLGTGVLSFTQEKTDAAVEIPMHSDLREHLEGLASTDSTDEFVMPGMSRESGSGQNGLSSKFKRIARSAGVDIQTVQGSGTRKLSRRTFHALRHSFTSALANAGVSEEIRMKLTGHKSKAVHRTYTHHEIATLRNAVGMVPSISGS